MSEKFNAVSLVAYFCMVTFFIISCGYSIRSFIHLKSSIRLLEDLYKKMNIDQKASFVDHTKITNDLVMTVENLEKKVDELRLQLGIMNGRMGDYNRTINLPFPPSSFMQERKKPGPKPGSKRKPKEIPEQK